MDFWRKLPAIVRIPVAIGIILLATCLFMHPPEMATPGPTGGAGLLFALGVILLFTGPTDAQKKGYHDF
jgi:hypothetical protein